MATYAHLALQNHNILPQDFMNMPYEHRATIIASDIIKAEDVKKAEEEARRAVKR